MNYELTGISYQLFTSEQSTGYTTTVQLFRTVPLTRLELILNTTRAEKKGFLVSLMAPCERHCRISRL